MADSPPPPETVGAKTPLGAQHPATPQNHPDKSENSTPTDPTPHIPDPHQTQTAQSNYPNDPHPKTPLKAQVTPPK